MEKEGKMASAAMYDIGLFVQGLLAHGLMFEI
jgi:hypothetical protein